MHRSRSLVAAVAAPAPWSRFPVSTTPTTLLFASSSTALSPTLTLPLASTLSGLAAVAVAMMVVTMVATTVVTEEAAAAVVVLACGSNAVVQDGLVLRAAMKVPALL